MLHGGGSTEPAGMRRGRRPMGFRGVHHQVRDIGRAAGDRLARPRRRGSTPACRRRRHRGDCLGSTAAASRARPGPTSRSHGGRGPADRIGDRAGRDRLRWSSRTGRAGPGGLDEEMRPVREERHPDPRVSTVARSAEQRPGERDLLTSRSVAFHVERTAARSPTVIVGSGPRAKNPFHPAYRLRSPAQSACRLATASRSARR